MMRIYQGIDLVEINRFKRVFSRRHGLLREIFTVREQKECLGRRDPCPHLAGRFAGGRTLQILYENEAVHSNALFSG